MQITLIGIVVIILSIIAFFKNEDWLLYLTIFFSTFVAASALNIYASTTAIVPFEIPLVLWIIRQFINIIKNRKNITKQNIRKIVKENKVFTALLIFTTIMIISEICLLISNINYSFYDTLYLEERVIKFNSKNITQPARAVCFLVFSMLLSIKIKDKEKIKELLKIFIISTIFAVLWGLIQFVLYYLNIEYPSFLFNNNPWYMQGIDQIMHGIKRINSIATEPSVFSLNLLAAIPIMMILCLYKENEEKRYLRVIINILLILTLVCAILTTSTTSLIGLAVIIISLLVFFVVKYVKGSKALEYRKKIVILILYCIISFVIALIFALCGNRLIKNTVIEQNNNTTDNATQNIEQNNITTDNATQNIEQNNIAIDNATQIVESNNIINIGDIESTIEYYNFFNAIKEMTISKLSSGSGQQRIEREILGFRIYLLSPILGVGFGSFRTFILFTNVLVNMGILGLISLLYLFYIVFKTIITNRKKNEKYFLIFLLSLIGMLVAFATSIPDLIYIYCWIILVLAYNYFKDEDKQEKMKKKNLIIGIDGRSLDLKNRTGITTYMYEVIKKLNDLDSKNTYYIYSNKDVNFDFKLNSNFEVRRYNSKKGTLGYYFKLPKILKKDNVDILWGTQHVLPMRNIYTKNIKFILTVHDLAIHKLKTVGQFKNTIIQRLFLKKSCRNADVIMADSKATKDDIVEIFGIDEQKIKVVYLGTNFSNEYNVSNKEEKGILKKFNIEDKNYLFFVSTIEPRKNIITLIKAYEVLKRKEENKTLKLILAGGLGWKYQDVLDTIEKSEFKEYINLAGYISKDEKECLLKNAKCFVYPSLYEGFGLPILEAMAKEAIVVTSNISSIPEVGGKAAFYLNNVHDENELASLIEKVLKLDEETKKEIIEKGHEQVKKFTWEKCANEVLSILRG